jgi:hypothetical protein
MRIACANHGNRRQELCAPSIFAAQKAQNDERREPSLGRTEPGGYRGQLRLPVTMFPRPATTLMTPA